MSKPPSLCSWHRTSLFIFSKAFLLLNFFFHRNLKIIVLIFFNNKSGQTRACIRYTNCDKRNVLIIWIFPIKERFLFSHLWINLNIELISSSQFTSSSEAIVEWLNITPRIFTVASLPRFHFKFPTRSWECLSAPNHIASVLFRLMFKPLNLANWFMILIVSSISCLSFKNRVISSAYNNNLRHCLWAPGNCMPVILLECRIFSAKISTARMKAKGEKGHPCLIPEFTGKNCESHPALLMQLSVPFVSTFTQDWNCGPNPNRSKTFDKNFLLTESKALV